LLQTAVRFVAKMFLVFGWEKTKTILRNESEGHRAGARLGKGSTEIALQNEGERKSIRGV
jgi:hypothetical protein